MCGIVGQISTAGNTHYTDRKAWFTQALYADAVRGRDGTGIFMVPEKDDDTMARGIVRFKKELASADFIQLDQYKAYMNWFERYKFVVGHNRSSTRGGRADANAHPFHVDHITLVHNGTIHSCAKSQDLRAFEVDSDWITHSIAYDGAEATLKQMRGSFALVWYDAKADALYMVRNDQRTLSYAKVKDDPTILFASEHLMLQWLAGRNNMELDGIYSVTPGKLFTFRDAGKPTVKDVKFWTEPQQPSRGSVHNATSYRRAMVGKQTKAKHRKTAALELKELGLVLKEYLNFQYQGTSYKKGQQSRHGKLTGFLNDINTGYVEVAAYGISRDKFNDGSLGYYLLNGRIIDVEHDSDDNPIIVVDSVAETKELAPYFAEQEAAKKGKVLTVAEIKERFATKEDRAEAAGKELSLLSDRPQVGDSRTCQGPVGLQIPLSEFYDLVAAGCANCTTAIKHSEAKLLTWTLDRQPVCRWCVKELHGHTFLQ